MNNIEWAVIQGVFRGVDVVKAGMGSREEAELWLAALEVTNKRANREHFMKTDGIIAEHPMEVAWRKIDHWHGADEEPPA